MGFIKERVSYLKGLAEGLKINEATNEGKLLLAIVDVLEDISLSIEEIEEVQGEVGEQVDQLDEDLYDLEKIVYDENCDCGCGDDCDCDDDCDCGCGDDCDCDEDCDCGCNDVAYIKIECPNCKGEINLDLDVIDKADEGESIECPNCHEKIEIDWECDCGCGEKHK